MQIQQTAAIAQTYRKAHRQTARLDARADYGIPDTFPSLREHVARLMRQSPTVSLLGVLQGLAGSLIVLTLPAGAGVALLAFASAQAWRLAALWQGRDAGILARIPVLHVPTMRRDATDRSAQL